MKLATQCFGLFAATVFLGLGGCEPPPRETVDVDVEAQQAVAGVGKGGRLLEDHSDFDKIMSGPISTLKHIQQLAPLEIQIPHALNLYNAQHGRMPKNHAEFMKEIIEFNKIQLPELPAGAVYHYNKEAGQLWVYPEDEVPQD